MLLSAIESNTHGLNAIPIADQIHSPLDTFDPANPNLNLPPAQRPDSARLIIVHDIDVGGFRVDSRVIGVNSGSTPIDLARPVRWTGSSENNIVDESCRLETPELLIESFDSAGTITLRIADRRLTLRPGEWVGEATVKSKAGKQTSQQPVKLVIGENDWEGQLKGALLRGDMVSRLTILNHGLVELR